MQATWWPHPVARQDTHDGPLTHSLFQEQHGVHAWSGREGEGRVGTADRSTGGLAGWVADFPQGRRATQQKLPKVG